MGYSSLNEIAQANVPVLLPDTCILLDLIRSPLRNTVDEHAINAGQAIRDAVHKSGSVGCVVAKQVHNELNDNLTIVRDETNFALTRLKDEIARIDKWSEALGLNSQTQIGHFLTCVPIAEAMMMDVVGASIRHVTTTDIESRAVARVMQKRTPAKLGKDSLKDCIVIESYLEVASELRENGHTGAIIFASSNTSEFLSGSPKKLNADIDAEFGKHNILYSRTLCETRHRLGL